tara:strand:+ start:4627 stop:5397 length:771 start_codon:yes stop_codon:yes gene_type:complete
MNSYNSWINKSAKNDGINFIDRSIIHMFLFPVVFSFLPNEIVKTEIVIAIYFMNSAIFKFNLLLPKLKEIDLIKTGIIMSISIIIIPYFFIYLLFMTIRILPSSNFTISKLIAINLPTVTTWFLVLTINKFLINFNFPYFINPDQKLYDNLIQDFEGWMIIAATITSFLSLFFTNKKSLYRMERNTYFTRLAFFIAHIFVVIFIGAFEAFIVLINSIVYGLSLFIRRIKNPIYKEIFLATLLFLSISRIYIAFDSI